MQLSGGVEKARAVPEGDGPPGAVAQGPAQVREGCVNLRVGGHIGLQGDVPATIGGGAIEEGSQNCFQGSGRGLAEDRDIPGPEGGLQLGEPAFFLVRLDHVPSQDLGRFHIGLVKGVDAQTVPGHDRGYFPAEEFAPQVVGGVQLPTEDGLAGLDQGLEGAVVGMVVPEAKIDEEAVVAVHGGWA